MARRSIRQLAIDIEARTARAERNLKATNQLLRRMEGQGKRTGQSLQRMGKQFDVAAAAGRHLRAGLAAAVGVLGAQAFSRGISNAGEFARTVQDMSERVGLSVETLQELTIAFEDTGGRAQTLQMAMQRFARRIGEAANSSGEFLGVAQEIGLELRDGDERLRSQEQLLGDLADAIAATASRQEQLRIAFKAFDSEGAAVLAILDEGREGLDRYREAARESGRVVGQDLVEALSDARTELGKLTGFIEASAIRALGGLAAVVAGPGSADPFTDAIIKAQQQLKGLVELQREVQGMSASQKMMASLLGDVPSLEEINRQIKALELNVRGIADARVEAHLARERQATADQAEIDRMARAKEAAEQAADAEAKRMKELERAAASLTTALESPLERFDRLVAAAVELRTEGLISFETFERAMDQYVTTLSEAADGQEDLAEAATSMAGEIEHVYDRAMGGVADSIARAVATGKLEMRSLVQSISQDLIRSGISKLIGGGLGKLGGFIDDAITARTAHGGVFVDGELQRFASGGVVTRPTLFPMAHGGTGIAGEGGRPEGVLPLARTSTGDLGVQAVGGGGTFAPTVNVVINDPPGGAAQGQQLGDTIGARVMQELRTMWKSEARNQMRPGGVLNPIT